jgi:hypothetical protein
MPHEQHLIVLGESFPRTRRMGPSFDARDLLHLASCKRRDVRQIKTYDRALAAALPGTCVITAAASKVVATAARQ